MTKELIIYIDGLINSLSVIRISCWYKVTQKTDNKEPTSVYIATGYAQQTLRFHPDTNELWILYAHLDAKPSHYKINTNLNFDPDTISITL